VGVIDSGWDRNLHNAQIHRGIGFVDPRDELTLSQSDDDNDRIGHGTACADLILAIAPQADIYPLRVFGRRMETSVSIINSAIRWAIDHDLRLVNMSLGTLRDDALIPMYMGCEQAREQGVIMVAARHNSNLWSYPAVFENVIGVESGDFASPYDFIYRPDEATECIAMGRHRKVLWLQAWRKTMSGTSFAAPNISGIVALLLERYPDASLEDIRTLLAKYSLRRMVKGQPGSEVDQLSQPA
jgi:subtilisin family serine protease